MVLLLSSYTEAILPESSRRSEQNHSSAEADRLRKEFGRAESCANQYKAANRFELPDQLDINLRTMEQLRREIDGNSQRLAALPDLSRSAKTSGGV